jgi:hypothetical protein
LTAPVQKKFPVEETEHRVLVECWREFTKEELQDKGEELALAEMQSDAIERERRESQSEFAKQLNDLRGRISQLSKQIQSKGGQRPTWCVVKFHEPAQGKKQIFRVDTGELVDVQEMTDAERQQKLFHEPGEAG